MNREIIERADQLLELIQTEKAGPADYEELLQLMEAHPEPSFITHIQAYFTLHPKNIPGQLPASDSPAWQNVLQSVLNADKPAAKEVRTPVRRMRTWWSAAAAVALLGGGVWFISLQKKVADPKQEAVAVRTPIEPGKEGAILTLEDGSTVVLDSLGNGPVAANAILQNGELSYDGAGNGRGRVVWNTITTPKARQFRLTLQDGTKVWLNAATVLRYPTSFTGSERKVELTGEAYFEVTKNAQQPFRVTIGDTATVDVLGTSFNINSYADEPVVRTTLLEGSVRMTKKSQAVLLQPGQQAVMQQTIQVDKNADTDGAVAWKSGKFNLEGASLEEFMRQLARWYNIEVEYKGRTPEMQLRGKPGRDLLLQDLLDGLADLGIRYKLEGHKLIIQ